MTKTQKLIYDALASHRRRAWRIAWTPISSGCEMEGPRGGWEVETSGGETFYGYNFREVVAAIDERYARP